MGSPMDTSIIKSEKSYKKYDETFKRQALEHWRTSGKTAEEVAQALGISTFSLYAWRKKYLGETGALPAGGAGNAAPRSLSALEAENAALRRELAHVRQQRDILKKTLGIISEDPPNATNGSKR